MKLALSAKITCSPKSVLQSRWAHDTAHVLAESVVKARRQAEARTKARRH